MDEQTDEWANKGTNKNEQTIGWMDGKAENLPILQEFIPYGALKLTMCLLIQIDPGTYLQEL